MTLKNALMVALIFMIAIIIIQPVSANALIGECIVPPDDYFVTDGPANGQPVHDGIQLGFVFWTYDDGKNQYSGDQYLGLAEYKLMQSHNDQEKIAMGKMWYCKTIPDTPYVPPVLDEFTSEDPAKSVYVTPAQQHAGFV